MTAGTPTDAGSLGRDEAGASSFTFLDQALWRQFREARDPAVYTRAWLALQCRFIGHVQCGVVVLGEPEVGPFAPVAHWPDEASFDTALSGAAERAMAARKGVALNAGDGPVAHVAYPVMVDEQLFGVVAVALTRAAGDVREVLRQLQWGVAWLEVLMRRRRGQDNEEERERTATAFDMLASALEHPGFRDACTAVVTELAMRLGCDPVSIGFQRRRRVVVEAISHAAQFGKRMNLIRDIGGAMDEAIDQEAVVLYPPHPDWEYRVTRAHAELASTHQAGSILTIPLHVQGKPFGAITLERPPDRPFDEATVEICDSVASVIGPILDEKRRNDRLILRKIADSIWEQLKRLLGPHYFGRKLATLVFVAVAAFFATYTDEYRVTSPAILEGEVQRTIVAPFDGYLASQSARPGEVVQEGQVLAALDDRDLALERLRWSTTRRQRATEYDRALAEGDRAQAHIAQAQIEQAEAQVELLDEQLARTQIRAPFAGVVVSGDLTQSVGATLQRGQELFKIAPLDAYRVILKVDEGDIGDVDQGDVGTLRLASLPDDDLAYKVERITPIAEQAEGRNFFRVEARLTEVSGRLRPGMEGVGKTDVDRRLLISIWTRKLVNWVRLTAWKWLA